MNDFHIFGTIRNVLDDDEQQLFVSNLAKGPSGQPFHFGNVDQRLANDVGQIVQASLESISRGGVCVFAPNYAKIDLLYQYWMAGRLFGGVPIFRQPQGVRGRAGEQFDDQLREFNAESNIRKAVLLTCYSGKMNELAERTYSCSKVVVFAGLQYIGTDRSIAVNILHKTIDRCLTYATDNNRAFVMLETDIKRDLRQLPAEVRRATLDSFNRFRLRLKTFCIRRHM